MWFVFLDIPYLFLQEQLVPTVGYKLISYQQIWTLSRTISTCNKAGILKDREAGPTMLVGNTLNLAAILKGQAKMQQKLLNLKKHSVDEMEALR